MRLNNRNEVFLFLCFQFLTIHTFAHNVNEMLVNGQLDLSDVSLDQGIAQFGGDAKFYWNKLYTQDEAQQNLDQANPISINNSWNNQPKHKSYKSKGYGTYYFTLTIPDALIGKPLMMRSNHFISYASFFFVNGKLVCNNGSVGTSREDPKYKPSRNTTCIPFTPQNSTLEVVVWVANFSHFRGGIFNNIMLGKADEMIAHRERQITYDLAVIISLLIMFLYHFLIYFVNHRDKIPLYFAFTCLLFAFDFSFQDTMSFFLFFPNVSFKVYSILHLIMPFLLPFSFIFFLHALFPNEVSKLIRNIVGNITISLVIISMFNDSDINMLIVKPHFAYTILIVFYVYYVAIKAIIHHREGSKMFLVAYIIFSLCVINDILFVFEIIHTASMVSTGLMVFVILLSILQGRRMANMYIRNARLTDNLRVLNLGLEEEVEKRTLELSTTNKKLTRLIQFKEDMTNMILHDLKTPINTIINSKLIKTDLTRTSIVQQAGYKMLHLVENILDVYRYQENKMDLKKEEVLVDDIIHDAIDDVRLSAFQKSIKIEEFCSLSYRIEADREVLRRVFVNILSNSIRYSPDHGKIAFDCTMNETGHAVFSISNEGKGIPKSKHSLIFEKFGQASDEGQSKSHSSGLGLAFCKIAVEAHKGEIGVKSETDKGVEFWLSIPNATVTNENIKPRRNEMGGGLPQNELLKLQPYIIKLKQLQVYQATEITQITSRIPISNNAVKDWVEKVESAMYSSNQVQYDLLVSPEKSQ